VKKGEGRRLGTPGYSSNQLDLPEASKKKPKKGQENNRTKNIRRGKRRLQKGAILSLRQRGKRRGAPRSPTQGGGRRNWSQEGGRPFRRATKGRRHEKRFEELSSSKGKGPNSKKLIQGVRGAQEDVRFGELLGAS